MSSDLKKPSLRAAAAGAAKATLGAASLTKKPIGTPKPKEVWASIKPPTNTAASTTTRTTTTPPHRSSASGAPATKQLGTPTKPSTTSSVRPLISHPGVGVGASTRASTHPSAMASHKGDPKAAITKSVRPVSGTKKATTTASTAMTKKTPSSPLSGKPVSPRSIANNSRSPSASPKLANLESLHNSKRPTSHDSDTQTSEREPMIKSVRNPAQGIPDELNSLAYQAFRNADKNGDGTIDEPELAKLLNMIYPGVTLPEVNRVYQAIDCNRSGKITFDEFIQAVLKYRWDVAELVDKTSLAASLKLPKQPEFDWEIPIEQLQLEKVIGQGTFGVVYSAKWHGCHVAVKQLKATTLDETVLKDFRSEISLMSKMRHPNVVLFMGASTQNNKYTIVTEFINGGSLYDIIHKGAKFNLSWALKVAQQTCSGLAYLHTRNPPIIHRDLKPMNILIDTISNHVKLIDFGLSCVKPKKDELKEMVGSPIWMAPEVLRGEPYTEKVDQYGFALCLLELFTGQTPYLQYDFTGLINDVGWKKLRPALPDNVPEPARDIITKCWVDDPAQRPSFSDLVDHPAFAHVK